MEPKALVLCDPEEDYARQMAAFLEKDDDFPWAVIVCTGRKELEELLARMTVEVLVLAESLTEDVYPGYSVKWLILLNESGQVRFPEIKNIDKYQEADKIRKELLKLSLGRSEPIYPALMKKKAAECIAFYSPVRRCLQTGLAIAYSQLLAEECRVLYLNFECYGVLPGIAECELESDMTSLLYHLDSGEEELVPYLKMIRKSVGNWDYIPPMKNSENMPATEAEDWLKLMSVLRNLDEYDYIVLDMHDGLQGMFELLKQCERIFTVVKNDAVAREKLQKYEYVLEKKGYKSIRLKTRLLQLPLFTRLPAAMEDYSRGELADYVREELIREEGHGIYGMEKGLAE